MAKQSEEAEEDVEREEDERVRTYSRTADNYWLCQTTSVMSAFQPSAREEDELKTACRVQRQTAARPDTGRRNPVLTLDTLEFMFM